MTIDLSTFITIVTNLVVGVGVIFTLRGDIKVVRELFVQHEKHDEENFKQIRSDISQIRYKVEG